MAERRLYDGESSAPATIFLLRIGIHTSRSKSLEDAALTAHRLGANTFQIFSASPRMWRPSTPDPADICRLCAARQRLDLTPLVIHTNYLINLATLDPEIRSKSVASFRGELDRAKAIGAEYLVVHPGNHKDQSLRTWTRRVRSRTRGSVRRLQRHRSDGAARKHRRRRHPHRPALRSNCESSAIWPPAKPICPSRIVSIHAISSPPASTSPTPPRLEETVASADRILGLDLVKVMHANDSKGALGSHLDRHENIGRGQIGEAGFSRILTHREAV